MTAPAILQRLLVALVVAGAIAVVWAGARARGAAQDADRELARLHTVSAQIEAIARLSHHTPTWAQRSRPALAPGGLSTAAADALAAAGVPASALASVSPAAESPVGPAGLGGVRRRAVLTIAPVTLRQSGAVLSAWREAHPDWTIASIDLSPEPGASGRNAPPPGSDLPLRAIIAIETLYVDPATATPATSAPGALR